MPRLKRDIDNLLRLREVIAEVPDDRLHMRILVEDSECGTAFCAAGWAAIDPVLGPRIRQELHVQLRGWLPEDEPAAPLTESDLHSEGFVCIQLALTSVLGLSAVDSDRLFASGIFRYADRHAVTKAEVLWNIDRLIMGKHARRYSVVPGGRGSPAVPRPKPP